jgi:dolichol-phosphate mannosyltransferase
MKNNKGATVGATECRTEEPSSDVPLIVPTRNEAPNVGPLLQRIARMEFDGCLEVILVDDSDDNTAEVISAAKDGYEFEVNVIHRPKGS